MKPEVYYLLAILVLLVAGNWLLSWLLGWRAALGFTVILMAHAITVRKKP